MRRQQNRHILNEFSQSLEEEKNFICRRLPKKNFCQEISRSNGKEIRLTSVRYHQRAVRAEQCFAGLTVSPSLRKQPTFCDATTGFLAK